MNAEANRAIAQRYYREILNEGNADVIDELVSADFVLTMSTYPEAYHGPMGLKKLVAALHAAFPDLHFTVEHLLAQGETVVGHWTASGTHSGSLHTVMGDVAASEKKFVIDGITWLRIVNDKLIESHANEDTLGLLMQLGVLPSPGAPAPTSTLRENAALVARYFGEVMNQGKLEVIDTLLAPNFAFRIPSRHEAVRGPEDFKQFVTELRSAFPDIRFTVERQVADSDKVAARWTITGTHEGMFLGIAATGNKVKDQGIDIFRIAGGKIAEVIVNENDFGLLQQVGAIPSPELATR